MSKNRNIDGKPLGICEFQYPNWLEIRRGWYNLVGRTPSKCIMTPRNSNSKQRASLIFQKIWRKKACTQESTQFLYLIMLYQEPSTRKHQPPKTSIPLYKITCIYSKSMAGSVWMCIFFLSSLTNWLTHHIASVTKCNLLKGAWIKGGRKTFFRSLYFHSCHFFAARIFKRTVQNIQFLKKPSKPRISALHWTWVQIAITN